MAKLGLESWSVCYSLTGGSQGISAWGWGWEGTFPGSVVNGVEEGMHTRCGLITVCSEAMKQLMLQ